MGDGWTGLSPSFRDAFPDSCITVKTNLVASIFHGDICTRSTKTDENPGEQEGKNRWIRWIRVRWMTRMTRMFLVQK